MGPVDDQGQHVPCKTASAAGLCANQPLRIHVWGCTHGCMGSHAGYSLSSRSKAWAMHMSTHPVLRVFGLFSLSSSWLCHRPWQICEDVQVPGGCLLLLSILSLKFPVPWQCQTMNFSESLAEITQRRARQYSKCLPHPPSFGRCWGWWGEGGRCCRGRGWVEGPSCITFWYVQPVFHKCKKSLCIIHLYFAFQNLYSLFLLGPSLHICLICSIPLFEL